MAPRYRILILVCLGLAAASFAFLGTGGASTQGRTFYVSANGSDRHAGTSPARAWRTIRRVSRAHLQPGDRVLFRGGEQFGGSTLIPRASGSAREPITFGSFGGGRAELRGTTDVWIAPGGHDLAFTNLDFSGSRTLFASAATGPGRTASRSTTAPSTTPRGSASTSQRTPIATGRSATARSGTSETRVSSSGAPTSRSRTRRSRTPAATRRSRGASTGSTSRAAERRSPTTSSPASRPTASRSGRTTPSIQDNTIRGGPDRDRLLRLRRQDRRRRASSTTRSSTFTPRSTSRTRRTPRPVGRRWRTS